VFNSIQVINYWFTLHRTLRLLYQQAQTFSPNIQGISDQNVTSFCTDFNNCTARSLMRSSLNENSILMSQVHNETDTQLIISKYKKNTMKKKEKLHTKARR